MFHNILPEKSKNELKKTIIRYTSNFVVISCRIPGHTRYLNVEPRGMLGMFEKKEVYIWVGSQNLE